MKKNSENNVSENMVENTVVAEPIMSEEQMQQYVDENLHMVPKNQQKRFDSLSLESKVAKIRFYYDMKKMREDARIKNSVVNRVREIFDKRHASIDDANDVLKFCNEFIDGYKLREIAKLDEEIARLEQMKQSLSE